MSEHSLYTHAALHPRQTLLAASAVGLAFAVGWLASRRGGVPTSDRQAALQTGGVPLADTPPSHREQIVGVAAAGSSRARQTSVAAAIDVAPEART